MDVGSAGEGEEMHVLIPVLIPVLSHVRVPGLSLGHGLGPHVMAGRAILANLRGMVGTGGMRGLVSVEAIEGDVDMASIVKHRGLVLHPAGVVDPHADGPHRRVTNAGYRRHRTRSSSCSVRSDRSPVMDEILLSFSLPPSTFSVEDALHVHSSYSRYSRSRSHSICEP